MKHDCPICRNARASKGPFRYRVRGRFTSKPETEELGSAVHRSGAQSMLDSFKQWPALEPDSLTIVDSHPDLPPA